MVVVGWLLLVGFWKDGGREKEEEGLALCLCFGTGGKGQGGRKEDGDRTLFCVFLCSMAFLHLTISPCFTCCCFLLLRYVILNL